MEIVYKTRGTCARKIKFSIENEIITSLEFVGGCDGNLKGISSLAIGNKASVVASLLKGIDCGGRGTSCPDQLSKAIEDALSH